MLFQFFYQFNLKKKKNVHYAGDKTDLMHQKDSTNLNFAGDKIKMNTQLQICRGHSLFNFNFKSTLNQFFFLHYSFILLSSVHYDSDTTTQKELSIFLP